MKSVRSILCLSVILAWVCCTPPQTMYHAYHHIPHGKWERGDTLTFKLAIADTASLDYKLLLLVRNTSDYPYQKLPLAVTYNLPDTAVWQTDTLVLDVANANGKWLGSGWGGMYQIVRPLKEARIDHPAQYTIKVVYLLNDSLLAGIADVGVQAIGN